MAAHFGYDRMDLKAIWEMSVERSLVGYRKEQSMTRRASKDNNLAILNPDLAAEWIKTILLRPMM